MTSAILNGYMYDGYNTVQGWKNAWSVGHRRWILNPTMGKVGFGQVGNYSDMYAQDMSVQAKIEDYVVWPAENMPVELMLYTSDTFWLQDAKTGERDDRSRTVSDMSTPWSCQLGENYKIVPAKDLTITITYPDGHEYVVPQNRIFCDDANYGCAVPVFDENGTLLTTGTRGRGCISFLAEDEDVTEKARHERGEIADQERKKIRETETISASMINPRVGFEDFGSNYKVKIDGVLDSKTGKATTIEYNVNFFELGL